MERMRKKKQMRIKPIDYHDWWGDTGRRIFKWLISDVVSCINYEWEEGSAGLDIVLICMGFRNKVPKTGWLKFFNLLLK